MLTWVLIILHGFLSEGKKYREKYISNIGTSMGEETPYKMPHASHDTDPHLPFILESCTHCERLLISP